MESHSKVKMNLKNTSKFNTIEITNPKSEQIMNAIKSILLVEDNLDDVALTQRAFKKSQIANEIIVVHDGAQALDFLQPAGSDTENPPLPAVVLLDLNLPKVSGLEVLERLRAHERTRLLPVVILTSSREEQDVMESYRLGANSYIRKPVDSIQFTEAVRQLGLYWLVVNVPPPKL
jgi:two-component system response regulator